MVTQGGPLSASQPSHDPQTDGNGGGTTRNIRSSERCAWRLQHLALRFGDGVLVRCTFMEAYVAMSCLLFVRVFFLFSLWSWCGRSSETDRFFQDQKPLLGTLIRDGSFYLAWTCFPKETKPMLGTLIRDG